MALATHSYHDGKKYMPASSLTDYTQSYFTDASGANHYTMNYLTGDTFFLILPYIEQEPLFKNSKTVTNPGTQDETVYQGPQYGQAQYTPVGIYINPSDPSGGPDGLYNGYGVAGYSVNATALPAFSKSYTNYYGNNWSGTSGLRPNLASGFPDGTSNTVLFAEHYSVTFTNYPWGPSATPNYWWQTSFTKSSIIEDFPMPSNAQSQNVQAPRSEGIILGLADGSARLLSASVSATTWQYACDPADGQSLGSDW